jgi:hypothetical protein
MNSCNLKEGTGCFNPSDQKIRESDQHAAFNRRGHWQESCASINLITFPMAMFAIFNNNRLDRHRGFITIEPILRISC